METPVKRYFHDIEYGAEGYASSYMKEDSFGDYVKFEDYDCKDAQLDRLAKYFVNAQAEAFRLEDANRVMWDEIKGIIEYSVPKECLVPVCEGGGPENYLATLAVSVAKMRNKIKELEKDLNDALTNHF